MRLLGVSGRRRPPTNRMKPGTADRPSESRQPHHTSCEVPTLMAWAIRMPVTTHSWNSMVSVPLSCTAKTWWSCWSRTSQCHSVAGASYLDLSPSCHGIACELASQAICKGLLTSSRQWHRSSSIMGYKSVKLLASCRDRGNQITECLT